MPKAHVIKQGNYYHDILAQPAALEASLPALAPSRALEGMGTEIRLGLYPRIVLTGMGSSYHGLHPLHLHLASQGIASTMMETSELIHYGTGLLRRGTLIIAVSQSGSSAETLRLLEINHGRAVILGVTNTPGSPLATHSEACVLTAAGPEHSVSCKTYVCAQAALRWLGDVLSGIDPWATLQDLAKGPGLIKGFLSTLEDRVAALAEELQDTRSLFLVGRGPGLASAGTGALIIKEAAHFHAEGMSSAAFRHGPLEMIHPRMHVLVFAGDPAVRAMNQRLLDEIVGHGGRGSLFSTEPAPEVLRPILEILHVQAVTLALAALAGKEAGAFRWATKITSVE